ncbi:MAG TPA: purine-binding chemotaxis protein CheW [Gammaproteobacteria bacterium]|nr:purine-binding chemotaxis protein CheW [Gammaproteobacteria bacterium]
MSNPEQQSAPQNDCWNSVGVWSKQSERCSRLLEVIHCQNCDIYKQAGRSRLSLQADSDYLQQWSDNLAQKPAEQHQDECSAIVFRLGDEMYALSTEVLNDVTHPRQPHRIPHRSNNVLSGLVNIRGELVLCISLAGLLGLRYQQVTKTDTGRMIVAQFDELTVAFPVDQVEGITRYAYDTVQEPPATLSRHDGNYIQGLLASPDTQTGLLNHQLIQTTINRLLR